MGDKQLYCLVKVLLPVNQLLTCVTSFELKKEQMGKHLKETPDNFYILVEGRVFLYSHPGSCTHTYSVKDAQTFNISISQGIQH